MIGGLESGEEISGSGSGAFVVGLETTAALGAGFFFSTSTGLAFA